MLLPVQLHNSAAGKVASCTGALLAGWGTFLATTQNVLGIVAAIAATVYSVYMSYDLWDRRRKRDK